jgi:hypothetical protein
MSSVLTHVSFTQQPIRNPSSLIYTRLSRHTGGVGLSGPVLKQFASLDEETNFWSNVMKPGAYEGHGNLTMSRDVGFL